MFLLRRTLPLSSFILETISSFPTSNILSRNSTKFSTMSTTTKTCDTSASSQDETNRRYEMVERGQLYSLNYRCYFRDIQTQTIVSPFHDIPLVNQQYSSVKGETIYNMVVEVSRWTNAKMEINKKLKMNPLSQDIKNGKPRFVHNVFPYHGYLWNYGALPQTWEDPNHTDSETKTIGDNDPLDVCEIGTCLHAAGSIVPVKIVGILGLIDEGETDWKLIAIDIRDKLASQINDIHDVETHCPGLLKATHRWFKYYKVPTGKPPNRFALSDNYGDRAFAQSIIKETRNYWEKLTSGETKVDEKACSIINTTLNNSSTIKRENAEQIVEADEKYQKEPANVDSSVDQVAFVPDEEQQKKQMK